MDKDLKKAKEHFEKSYFNEQVAQSIKTNVFDRIEKRKWNYSKKLIYTLGTVILFVGLFVGSAFVSPTMAKVVAKVPGLNQMIKSMDETEDRKENIDAFFEAVHDTLTEEYKENVNVAMGYLFVSDAPEIDISIKNKTSDKEDKINKIIKEKARTYKIGDVKIKVNELDMDMDMAHVSEKDKKEREQDQKIFEIAEETLQKVGYKVLQLGILPDSQTLTLKIELDKGRFQQEKKNIEKLVQTAIFSKTALDYKIDLTRRSEAEITDMKWQPIFETIMDESHKEFQEVTGFAYSFHPKPLEIIIKTSLKNGKQDKEQAKIIEEYVTQVVEIKQEKLKVDKIPYKIIIRDKSHKEIYKKLHE